MTKKNEIRIHERHEDKYTFYRLCRVCERTVHLPHLVPTAVDDMFGPIDISRDFGMMRVLLNGPNVQGENENDKKDEKTIRIRTKT